MNKCCAATRLWTFSLILSLLLALSPYTQARELTLAIFPVLPKAQTIKTYTPLANYIGAAIGQPIRIETSTNFLSHYQLMKHKPYDLVLDGPHFVAYRLDKMGHRIIAKFPSEVSYSLVAHVDSFILDTNDMLSGMIATTPSPGLGALRLEQIFPNPMRQPEILEATDSVDAARAVMEKRALGAMIPTSMVANYPELTTVLTTEQVPAPAITAGPSVDDATVEKIRTLLLNAANTPEGREVLDWININGFENADPREYLKTEVLLAGMWDS